MNIPAATYVYAGLWRRFWAFAIDVLFVLALIVLVQLALPEQADLVGVGLVVIGYPVWSTAIGGGVGKRMLSLRVLREADGQPLNPLRAALRELMVKPTSILAAGVGVLWMLDDRERRTWHDLAAGSVVVRELHRPSGPAWADPALRAGSARTP